MPVRLARLSLLTLGIVVAAWGYKARQAQHGEGAIARFEHLPDSRMVEIASLGHHRLTSDFFWLRAIQYYGNWALREEGYPRLGAIIDLVTDLTPRFEYAYRFAGVAVPYNHPDRGFLNVDEAIRLLDKGVRNRPDVWQIGMFLGFAHLWYRGDSDAAIHGFEVASRAEGRPAYVPLLAARLHSHRGDPSGGLAFAQAMLEETTDPDIRRELEQRVRELEIEMVLQKLDAEVQRFRDEVGRLPRDIDELFTGNPALTYAIDREALKLRYDAEEGMFYSGLLRRRLNLPREMVEEAAQQRAVGKSVGEP